MAYIKNSLETNNIQSQFISPSPFHENLNKTKTIYEKSINSSQLPERDKNDTKYTEFTRSKLLKRLETTTENAKLNIFKKDLKEPQGPTITTDDWVIAASVINNTPDELFHDPISDSSSEAKSFVTSQ